MTNLLDAALIETPDDHAFGRGLRGYVAAVATGLGVGLESCALELSSPASAYIALDGPITGLPDRDLALLWDERTGWSAVVEPPAGEDPIVLAFQGGGLVPRPSEVYAFVASVRAGNHAVGQPDRPTSAAPVVRPELALLLRAYDVTNGEDPLWSGG